MMTRNSDAVFFDLWGVCGWVPGDERRGGEGGRWMDRGKRVRKDKRGQEEYKTLTIKP